MGVVNWTFLMKAPSYYSPLEGDMYRGGASKERWICQFVDDMPFKVFALFDEPVVEDFSNTQGAGTMCIFSFPACKLSSRKAFGRY